MTSDIKTNSSSNTQGFGGSLLPEAPVLIVSDPRKPGPNGEGSYNHEATPGSFFSDCSPNLIFSPRMPQVVINNQQGGDDDQPKPSKSSASKSNPSKAIAGKNKAGRLPLVQPTSPKESKPTLQMRR